MRLQVEGVLQTSLRGCTAGVEGAGTSLGGLRSALTRRETLRSKRNSARYSSSPISARSTDNMKKEKVIRPRNSAIPTWNITPMHTAAVRVYRFIIIKYGKLSWKKTVVYE